LLFEVRDLDVRYGRIHAVRKVSLELAQGQIVAVLGANGAGKSSLLRSLLGLVKPTAGELALAGHSVDIARPSAWKPFRKDFQIVFQDPYTSLNPRHTVFEILEQPMRVHRVHEARHLKDAAAHLLEQVGLDASYLDRFPHAFSGGQRQRIGIARAIGVKPRLLVCDEVVAALDVSVQAQIIELLMDLKARLDLSLLFISHDLSLVKSVSDRVLVMYLGKIVEEAKAADLFAHPRHPYTAALLESIPTLDRARRPKLLGGEIPSPVNLPPGCAFAGRCPRVQDRCKKEAPALLEAGASRAACFYPIGLPAIP